jgi:YggT family protein
MLILTLLNIYSYILLARVLMSWVNPSPFNPIVQIIYKLTEPVLAPVRRVLPAFGPIDLSPIVVFAAIYFLKVLI